MFVSTTLGTYQGTQSEYGMVFKGIKYATVPHRFRSPQPVTAHDGIYDATYFREKAYQAWVDHDALQMSEDCLHLNIWTQNIETLKPVVVSIHGGGFTAGTGADALFNGDCFIKNHDIVYVSLNYRLGVFGFLDVSNVLGGAYNSSGNNGILDLIEGLRFIHEHIKAFGGDPNQITIMGESAGAKCVATLLTNLTARQYFNQAILQSGALQCIRDKSTATAIATDYLTALTSIVDEDHLSVDELLLTQSPDVLINAQQKIASLHTFGPVIDNEVIATDPYVLLEQLKPFPLTVLMGYNKHEAELFLDNNDAWLSKERHAMESLFGLNTDTVLDIDYDWSATLTKYLYQNASLDLATKLISNGHDVYFYRFDCLRACHAQDLAFVFDARVKNDALHTLPESAYPTAKFMHDTWANFIKRETLNVWPRLNDTNQMLVFNNTHHVEIFESHLIDFVFPLQVLRR